MDSLEITLQQKLEAQEAKLNAIYASVEKTRTYMQWILIGTLVMFLLPLLGLLFAIPQFLSVYSSLDVTGI